LFTFIDLIVLTHILFQIGLEQRSHMLMATTVGMPLFALAALCMGEIPVHLTLRVSTPTSGPQKGLS